MTRLLIANRTFELHAVYRATIPTTRALILTRVELLGVCERTGLVRFREMPGDPPSVCSPEWWAGMAGERIVSPPGVEP